MTLDEFLKDIREKAWNSADLGRRFEKFIRQFLLSKAAGAQYTDVWLWGEFPHWKGHDVGIDLVARDTFGEYTAVQCKCYRPGTAVSKEDVDTFLSASGKSFQVEGRPTRFAHRLLVSTNDNWSAHAEEAIQDQNPPVARIGLAQLRTAVEAAGGFDLGTGRVKTAPFKPKPHQELAVRDVLAGFAGADRGQLIMACGTGKTYTSLRIAEEMRCRTVLVLVPSISLLSQSLRVWVAQAREEIATLAVCSDSKADREEGDISVCDLGFPATTSAELLVRHGKALKAHPPKGMTVVFSTYQSIDAVGDAQKAGAFGTFDLIVCDEAHRTTGATFAGAERSSFTKVHDDACVRGRRRLYMTATPRIYCESAKKRADEEEMPLWSMDDETVYGREFHHLSFSAAVAQDLLSDYKVEVLAVAEKDIRALGLKDWDGDGTIDNVEDVGKWIGCWKAFNKRLVEEDMQHLGTDREPMRSVVAFSSSIRESKTFAAGLGALAGAFAGREGLRPAKVRHVDGTMNALDRSRELDWLRQANEPGNTECRILSNAKCLSEGVDVPGLDAIAFLSPKNSFVEVVQAIGRVMRKAPGKQFGYVIIPVVIPEGLEPDAVLSDNKRFKVVWDILSAIRSHDDGFHTLDNKVNILRVEPPRAASARREEAPPLPPSPSIPAELFGEYQKAIKAKLAKVCGERKYWSTWATEVAEVVRTQIARIRGLLERPGNPHEQEFGVFLEGLRANLNPTITKDDAIEMLAQQLVSAPIFSAVFGDFDFVAKNPVSQSLAPMLQRLDAGMSPKDRGVLETFQQSVRNKAAGHTTSEQKQHIIIELYNNFFNIAFKDTVEKLGIVYTPIPCVDFIIHSVAALLKKHFGKNIADRGVHFLDPFTGTGTFPVRLLQSGLIPAGALESKYASEIHVNEIVLLAYYIAAINIEAAFHDLAEKAAGKPVPYRSFDGIVLADTFQLGEKQRRIDSIFPENSRRAQSQNDTPITVVVGNPPYSIGQKSANDDAQNVNYPVLDKRIGDTYAQGSGGKLRKSLYDSYVRAFRWATDRLGDEGIVAFISNAGWLDNKAMNGFRLSLQKEFSDVYVLNLRGNCNTKGEERRREGDGVFGLGSRTPIAITILVKTKKSRGQLGTIHYHDIGDYRSREEKLKLIEEIHDLNGIDWDILTPDKYNDWLNQRNGEFDKYIPLVSDKMEKERHAFFAMAPVGISSNRDAWVWNFSRKTIEVSIQRSSKFFNDCIATGTQQSDTKSITWTRGIRNRFEKRQQICFDQASIRTAAYRPFCIQNLCFDRNWIEMIGQSPKLFPTSTSKNLIICCGRGSAIITDHPADLHFCGDVHCFPFYWYEIIDSRGGQFTLPGLEPTGRYIRHDGISDFIQREFEKVLGTGIPKEDIFYWVYGALHSPRYRTAFEADLKKQLPRLPLPEDRPAYERVLRIGRELARLHLHYEEVEPWPLEEVAAPGAKVSWRVEKLRFGKKKGGAEDRSVIVVNPTLRLEGIPEEAYGYVVNGRSAIEWIMDRYQVRRDADSGIVNDPNKWGEEHGNERYIVDLIARVVRVGMESVLLVAQIDG